MVELREHERKTLSTLQRLDGKATTEQLTNGSGLPDAAIMRAALTLREKGLVEIREERQTFLGLNEEGKLHAKKGLPERRLTVALEELGGKATPDRAFEKASLEKQFNLIALSGLRGKNGPRWIRKRTRCEWAKNLMRTVMKDCSNSYTKNSRWQLKT